MVSWIASNFILVIYNNAFQLNSHIGPLAMARRVLWVRSVCPSVKKLSWNWVLGVFCNSVFCQTPRKYFCPKNGENKPSLGFFECIENLVLSFFSIWSIVKFYINCWCLHKSHIWDNSGPWDLGKNALGELELQDF